MVQHYLLEFNVFNIKICWPFIHVEEDVNLYVFYVNGFVRIDCFESPRNVSFFFFYYDKCFIISKINKNNNFLNL